MPPRDSSNALCVLGVALLSSSLNGAQGRTIIARWAQGVPSGRRGDTGFTEAKESMRAEIMVEHGGGDSAPRESAATRERAKAVTGFCFAAAIAAFCLLFTWGCIGGGDARRPDELILVMENNPVTLDPHRVTDVNGARLCALLYDTLVVFDSAGRPKPLLCRRWRISRGGRLYEFELRRNVTFHPGGAPLTARDVKASFERLLSPRSRSPRRWVLDKIAGAADYMAGRSRHLRGVRIIGDHRLEVELEEPFAPFLCMLAMPQAAVLPAGTPYETKGPPPGTGPWRLLEYSMDEHVLLERVPGWYGEAAPKGGAAEKAPAHSAANDSSLVPVSRIRFLVCREPLTTETLFSKGLLDAMILPSSKLAAMCHASDHEEKQGWRLVARPPLDFYYIGLNCERPPWNDAEVRRALAMSIDRRKIVETVRRNQAIPAWGPIPPGLPSYDPEWKALSYAPERARETISRHGLAGKSITILQSSRRENYEVTRLVASFFEAAGLKPRIESREWGVFKQRLADGDFEAFYLSWWADYYDEDDFFTPLFHSSSMGGAGNYPRYSDPKADRMMEEARRERDPRRRIRLYRELQRRVTLGASRLFLFFKEEKNAVQPWVHGLEFPPIYGWNKMTGVRLDAGFLSKRLEGGP